MNRTGKYELMRTEYIHGDDSVTYASLGAKYGRSPGSIGPIAQREGWIEARAQHRARISAKVDEQMTMEVVGKLVEMKTKFVDATTKSIDAYVRAVDAKQITPNATDIARLALAARELTERLSGKESSEDEGDGIHISGASTRDLARAIEAAARSRTDDGAVAVPARPKLVGSSG